VANPALEMTWGTAEAAGAADRRVAASDVPRAAAELTFRGTGVDWYTLRGRDQGRAEIWVDGRLVRRVDNYATARSVEVRSVTGLAEGLHTLRIIVLGQSRPAALGAAVSIDRLTVVV
jgi:hypothetical protein